MEKVENKHESFEIWGVVVDDRGGGYAKLRIMKAFSFQTIDLD